jgi:hypothetical protein
MVNLFGGFGKRLQDCTVMNEEEARVAAVIRTSSTMTGKKRKVNV